MLPWENQNVLEGSGAPWEANKPKNKTQVPQQKQETPSLLNQNFGTSQGPQDYTQPMDVTQTKSSTVTTLPKEASQFMPKWSAIKLLNANSPDKAYEEVTSLVMATTPKLLETNPQLKEDAELSGKSPVTYATNQILSDMGMSKEDISSYTNWLEDKGGYLKGLQRLGQSTMSAIGLGDTEEWKKSDMYDQAYSNITGNNITPYSVAKYTPDIALAVATLGRSAIPAAAGAVARTVGVESTIGKSFKYMGESVDKALKAYETSPMVTLGVESTIEYARNNDIINAAIAGASAGLVTKGVNKLGVYLENTNALPESLRNKSLEDLVEIAKVIDLAKSSKDSGVIGLADALIAGDKQAIQSFVSQTSNIFESDAIAKIAETANNYTLKMYGSILDRIAANPRKYTEESSDELGKLFKQEVENLHSRMTKDIDVAYKEADKIKSETVLASGEALNKAKFDVSGLKQSIVEKFNSGELTPTVSKLLDNYLSRFATDLTSDQVKLLQRYDSTKNAIEKAKIDLAALDEAIYKSTDPKQAQDLLAKKTRLTNNLKVNETKANQLFPAVKQIDRRNFKTINDLETIIKDINQELKPGARGMWAHSDLNERELIIVKQEIQRTIDNILDIPEATTYKEAIGKAKGLVKEKDNLFGTSDKGVTFTGEKTELPLLGKALNESDMVKLGNDVIDGNNLYQTAKLLGKDSPVVQQATRRYLENTLSTVYDYSKLVSLDQVNMTKLTKSFDSIDYNLLKAVAPANVVTDIKSLHRFSSILDKSLKPLMETNEYMKYGVWHYIKNNPDGVLRGTGKVMLDYLSYSLGNVANTFRGPLIIGGQAATGAAVGGAGGYIFGEDAGDVYSGMAIGAATGATRGALFKSESFLKWYERDSALNSLDKKLKAVINGASPKILKDDVTKFALDIQKQAAISKDKNLQEIAEDAAFLVSELNGNRGKLEQIANSSAITTFLANNSGKMHATATIGGGIAGAYVGSEMSDDNMAAIALAGVGAGVGARAGLAASVIGQKLSTKGFTFFNDAGEPLKLKDAAFRKLNSMTPGEYKLTSIVGASNLKDIIPNADKLKVKIVNDGTKTSFNRAAGVITVNKKEMTNTAIVHELQHAINSANVSGNSTAEAISFINELAKSTNIRGAAILDNKPMSTTDLSIVKQKLSDVMGVKDLPIKDQNDLITFVRLITSRGERLALNAEQKALGKQTATTNLGEVKLPGVVGKSGTEESLNTTNIRSIIDEAYRDNLSRTQTSALAKQYSTELTRLFDDILSSFDKKSEFRKYLEDLFLPSDLMNKRGFLQMVADDINAGKISRREALNNIDRVYEGSATALAGLLSPRRNPKKTFPVSEAEKSNVNYKAADAIIDQLNRKGLGTYGNPEVTLSHDSSFKTYKVADGVYFKVSTIDGVPNYSAVTTGLQKGSGQGSDFYKQLFTLVKETNGKFSNTTGLSPVNTIRMPINVYKFKLDTGYNVYKDQRALHNVAIDAITEINGILRRGYKIEKVAELSDEEISKLIATEPAKKLSLTSSALKLFREMARKLSNGEKLSITALAPLINAAYEENTESEANKELQPNNTTLGIRG